MATGETFHSLQYSFRISVPAISLIIAETIDVIYEVLHTEYLCVSMPRGTQMHINS